MAMKFEIEKHHYGFPSKLLAGNGGAHIFNIVLSEDTDNFTVVSRGDYVSFDQYKAATAPVKFEGKILEQAADGTWYVEVVEPADAILIYEVPVMTMGNYDSRFTDIANWYNEAGKTVRGYGLVKGDVYAISEDTFDKKPVVGKKVTISGQNHVVGA